jgi:transposase InsO family protein
MVAKEAVMPWKERTVESARAEFVQMVLSGLITTSEACRRAGISRKTGYKWLKRYVEHSETELRDRSRRPKHSPYRTEPEMEALVVAMRLKEPAWGGRTIARRLADLGHDGVPHPNTITDILRRHQVLEPITAPSQPPKRFEHAAPNDLWQMDFKGPFLIGTTPCHPLSLIDDHSRFALGLEACTDQRRLTVQSRLVRVFRAYGLPERMLMDNGSPWGKDREYRHTRLTAWLMRLGIVVSHGRPFHPETQGKVERFNRTLQVELLRQCRFKNLADCQQQFDRWRYHYNHERPHQALELATPITRYRPSPRSYPEQLPAVEYGPDDTVRIVQTTGRISYGGRVYNVGRAFQRQPVALRPTNTDGVMEVYYINTKIRTLDLRT